VARERTGARVRGLIVVGVLTTLMGCSSVRQVRAPGSYIERERPSLVWVTDVSGETTPVSQPRVVRDSIRGTWALGAEEVAVSISNVKAVYAKQPDARRTGLLIVGGGAGLVLIYLAAENGRGEQARCIVGMGGMPVCS
jgi:hypothetical protein